MLQYNIYSGKGGEEAEEIYSRKKKASTMETKIVMEESR
jgi:hypothetical protein